MKYTCVYGVYARQRRRYRLASSNTMSIPNPHYGQNAAVLLGAFWWSWSDVAFLFLALTASGPYCPPQAADRDLLSLSAKTRIGVAKVRDDSGVRWLRACSAPDVAGGIPPCRWRKDALLTLPECDCSALPFDVEVGSKKVRSCSQMARFYLDGTSEGRKRRI
jgi:hypothetical protein